jgi:hypothetical protein
MMDKQPLSTFSVPGHRVWIWRLIAGLFLAALTGWGLFSVFSHPVAAAPLFQAAAGDVVISEFRTNGPSGGNDEFIEIFNPTEASVDISGWKIMGSTAAGIKLVLATIPSTLLSPGQHYLVGNLEYSGTVPWDLSYDTGIVDPGGIALTLADGITVIDQVGMSAGSFYGEGTRLSSLTGNQDKSYERLPGGPAGSCNDTDNNFTDFQNLAPSDPQNLLSAPVYCAGILTVTPTATVTPTLTPTTTLTATITETPTLTPTLTPTILTPTTTATVTLTRIITFTPTRTRTATIGPTPLPAHVIVINEVAWAGTIVSSTDEWIELYNPGSASIDLSAGWHLDIVGTTTVGIDLGVSGSTPTLTPTSAATTCVIGGASATIPAGGYFLLERGDDNTVCDIAADQIFNTSLPNSGIILRLYDPFGTLVDTANNDGGSWPAGHDTSKPPYYCSMERAAANAPDTNAGWFTNDNIHRNGHDANGIDGGPICGTPKNKNWAYSVTATPTPSSTIIRTPSKTIVRTKTRTPTRTPFKISSVIINEFLAQPRSDWNRDGKVDVGDQFIEIKNLSTDSVSLSGYTLDDQNGGSSPFSLPSTSIEPGARLVYYASETNILLSTGGDSVRLFKSGAISDAYTYGVVQTPDQSWCRLPDGSYLWKFGCEPTPQESNRLAQNVPVIGQQTQSKLCLSESILPALYDAECSPSGQDIWSRYYWLWEMQSGYPRYIQKGELEFIIE